MTRLALSMALSAAMTLPAFAAEPAWPDLSAQIFEDRPLQDGSQLIAIDAPYRTSDDARTQIAAQIEAPNGRLLDNVQVILDENTMPVSAVFTFDKPLPRFFFDITMRVNGPTPLHVVAETTDGQLYVAETFVKTSGLGACSAPPGTDPEVALASLGNMSIGIEANRQTASVSEKLNALMLREKQVDVDISHPSHSGMQMDQITLLFIPMRYVESLEVDLDGGGYVDITGSISLSENPRISMSVPRQTHAVDVTMTDTDGTVSHARKTLEAH